MESYKDKFYKLYNATAEAIALLQSAQNETIDTDLLINEIESKLAGYGSDKAPPADEE